MKKLICVLVNLIAAMQLAKSASVAREQHGSGVVRVKRFDEQMIAAGVEAAAGLATSFMDLASKGGGVKDERDFQADIPFASFKGMQKSGAGAGDMMGEEYRRRKRAPCSGGKPKTTTTIAPPAEAVAEEAAARKKRQAINDPDNVRPKYDGKPEIQTFLDTFVELAKKIGNIFVPSDPNHPGTRQQEMDDRY